LGSFAPRIGFVLPNEAKCQIDTLAVLTHCLASLYTFSGTPKNWLRLAELHFFRPSTSAIGTTITSIIRRILPMTSHPQRSHPSDSSSRIQLSTTLNHPVNPTPNSNPFITQPAYRRTIHKSNTKFINDNTSRHGSQWRRSLSGIPSRGGETGVGSPPRRSSAGRCLRCSLPCSRARRARTRRICRCRPRPPTRRLS
jgi:hypothetical protein